MKFFIILALVVAALADDLTSEEHKHRGYAGYRRGYGHGYGGNYRRGRRDVEELGSRTPTLVSVDQSLEEHRNRGYGGVYGGYRGGYGQYPSRYPGYGGYYTGHYVGHRGRRDVALVAEVPEVLQVSADLTADEHYRRRYGYSSYGYGYPRYGYSNYGYGNRGYGYRRW